MQLSREHFSVETLAAMDKAARLLYVSEKAIGLGTTFVNTGYFEEAEAKVATIVGLAEKVSLALLGARFHTNKQRRDRFRAASKSFHAEVQ